MKKILGISALVLLGLLFSNQCVAKKKKIKFGKVGLEDLEMKVYALDTSAPAVIIYEGGYYDAVNHQFYQHKRIKILKKEGYFMADNEFYTTSKGSIKGITFNIENGEIVKSKLEKDHIYEEKLWDYKYTYNVAMPDVRVGSVLDIEIKYDGFPYIWFFQGAIPIVKSEVELGDSQFLTFRKQVGGLIRPEMIDYNHWVAENVPAFISEPYLSSSKNYLTRVEFDINETHFPGYYTMEYASSWKSVDNILQKYSKFGKIIELGSTGFLNKSVKKIKNTATSETEKVRMAVETIKSIMEWNGYNRLLISEKTLQEVAGNKNGNSADINIMLIKLLQRLDIEVYPLVLSTRSNGMLHPVYPSLWKLNYVLAYVRVDGKEMVLDATMEELPYDMLPIRCLNYSGRVLDQRGTKKFSLITDKKFVKRNYYDLTLDENFTLTGKVSYMSKDYAAYDFRLDYDDYLSEQDYVDNLMDSNDGLSITEFTIENIEILEKPVVEKYDVEIEDMVSIIDNQAYINMFMFEQINENPFKSEKRKYPIDFTYARANTGVVRIKLPENYTIEELPETVNINLPENSAQFTMIYQYDNNVLTLNYNLLINRFVFGEKVYVNIKEFYAQVVSNQSKPVIVNINE